MGEILLGRFRYVLRVPACSPLKRDIFGVLVKLIETTTTMWIFAKIYAYYEICVGTMCLYHERCVKLLVKCIWVTTNSSSCWDSVFGRQTYFKFLAKTIQTRQILQAIGNNYRDRGEYIKSLAKFIRTAHHTSSYRRKLSRQRAKSSHWRNVFRQRTIFQVLGKLGINTHIYITSCAYIYIYIYIYIIYIFVYGTI